jgi:hypothetical protein
LALESGGSARTVSGLRATAVTVIGTAALVGGYALATSRDAAPFDSPPSAIARRYARLAEHFR